jgi:DsbC/DsbD-like thiol-disulfide interchange protein/cytochrome c biogenesis protein CcdA
MLAICVLALSLAPGASAAPVVSAQLTDQALNVPASLAAETLTPAAGQKVTIALHFKPKPGWHGYWSNPGDAGFGMQLKWMLPRGVSVGALRYPVPEPLLISGLMNHVFQHEYTVLADLTLDPNLARGIHLPIKVRGDWLSCTDQICVPEGDDLAIGLTVGDGAILANTQMRFDNWRAALPAIMDQTARYAITGARIEIAVPIARGSKAAMPYFFPATEKLFRYPAPQTARRTGDWLIVSGEVKSPYSQIITGVLRINDGQGLAVNAKPGAIPTGGELITTFGQGTSKKAWAGDGAASALLSIIGLAILGGLILNLMPCVFPILGLKAVALAKAGGDEYQVRKEALAYTAGIMLSCLALGAVMLTLRAVGQEIGWAFQLQEPVVVLLLLLLMVAVTANLAGAFEISSIGAGDHLTRKGGVAGSFWTGVLAAIVATPCSGPFMATAIGAALMLPKVGAILVFAGLGFGLALPFLLIAFVPGLRSMIPRPGPWMGTFQRLMALPMAATAIALLWLLWRISGMAGLAIGGISGLTLSVLLVRLGTGSSRSSRGGILIGVAAVVIAALLTLQSSWLSQSEKAGKIPANAFSESRLAELQNKGSSIFVYFTADWCVTCKLNEAAAIDREETIKAFQRNGIITLKGDFTRRDSEISRFLAKHNRAGVPFYIFYAKGQRPTILPQILSAEQLIDLGNGSASPE